MVHLRNNILLSIVLIVFLYAIGYFVYHHLEGWGPVDSIYFQTMTFTTIGYGDIVPKTDEGKLFTVFISWVGISIAFFVLYTISTYRAKVIDEKVNRIILGIRNVAKRKKTPPHPETLLDQIDNHKLTHHKLRSKKKKK